MLTVCPFPTFSVAASAWSDGYCDAENDYPSVPPADADLCVAYGMGRVACASDELLDAFLSL
jgi:hypothetical protein